MRRKFLNLSAARAAIVGWVAGSFVAGLVVAGLFIGGAAPARAEDAPTAMIIIDDSGSMWGRLLPANRSKIDLVRDKLAAVLAAPATTRVGLVSYGRRRGGCTDVEVIAGPDSARQDLLDPISKLNPRGPGPITAALKLAADAIGPSRPAQIVMVADNADNCQPDTCEVVKQIAANSPGVAVQVIGVGVPPAERPRMVCIAEATGGHYYDITDSDGLNAALDEATKLAILSPSAVAGANPSASDKPTAPPPPAGASLRASASLASGGTLLTVPLKWRIYKAGGHDVLGESEGHDIAAKLSAGDYTIEAQLGSLKARQDISIADGDAQSIVLAFNAAHLATKAIASKGGPPSPSAIITVAAGDAPIALARGGSADLYLAPADYRITVLDGAARNSQTLTLAAGDERSIDVALGTGRLDVSATGAANAPIQDVLYTVETDDPESPNGRREVARSRSPHASFTLPEGTYYLGASSGNGSTSKRIALGAGQTVSETIAITLVPVKISALVGGAPAKDDQTIFYRIDRIDGDRVSIARAIGPALALDLSPGRYRISASLATSHLSASQEFVFEDGKPAKAVIDIASGQVSFTPPAGAVPAFGDVYWEVTDAGGMPIWRATGAEATAILAPGQYTVRFDARDTHGQAAFEVRAGESQKIEIGPG